MSTMRELIAAYEAALNTGTELPVVGFIARQNDMETYLEAGMKARVREIRLHENCPEEEGGNLYEVVFDFSEFDDHNKRFESSNYWDGFKPKNGHEGIYYMELPDKYGDYFSIEGSLPVTVRIPDQDAFDQLVIALRFHESTLQMRVKEAMTGAFGGDTKSRDEAEKDLAALLRVVKAVGVEL